MRAECRLILVLVTSMGAAGAGAGGADLSAQPAARYEITPLGTLGGRTSEAHAINQSGQVAGTADTADGRQHAFLFSNDQMRDLGTLGGRQSEGFGINDTGDVVGGSDVTARTRRPGPGGAPSHAFIHHDGTLGDLGYVGPYEGSATHATAVNSRGEIAGESDAADNFTQHAFLISKGRMRDIGLLAPGTGVEGTSSAALGINETGAVVGQFDASGGPHAFIFENGQMQDLNDLAGKSKLRAAGIKVLASAVAISDGGIIVGVAESLGSPPGGPDVDCAFMFTKGAVTNLGTKGRRDSRASAVNESGQIVGSMGDFNSDKESESHAFLYFQRKMIDLNEAAGAGPLAKAGFAVLTEATGINEKGEIAGVGIDTEGNRRAFLLSPKSTGN